MQLLQSGCPCCCRPLAIKRVLTRARIAQIPEDDSQHLVMYYWHAFVFWALSSLVAEAAPVLQSRAVPATQIGMYTTAVRQSLIKRQVYADRIQFFNGVWNSAASPLNNCVFYTALLTREARQFTRTTFAWTVWVGANPLVYK